MYQMASDSNTTRDINWFKLNIRLKSIFKSRLKIRGEISITFFFFMFTRIEYKLGNIQFSANETFLW